MHPAPAMPPCDPLPGSLTFLTSGGLGNQYYGLQIAAWLAIALRRGTLVVPPILRHFKLGGPAGRGCESGWACCHVSSGGWPIGDILGAQFQRQMLPKCSFVWRSGALACSKKFFEQVAVQKACGAGTRS